MGIGMSIFLVAAGAILRWGVADQVEGVNFAVIGLILMIVGVVGLIVSLFLANMWTRGRDRTVIRDREPY